MTPFETATRDLLALIAEVLDDVPAVDRKSAEFLALVSVGTKHLANSLAIDEGFPDLPDAPLRDVQRYMDSIRARLAEIREEADTGQEPTTDVVIARPQPGGPARPLVVPDGYGPTLRQLLQDGIEHAQASGREDGWEQAGLYRKLAREFGIEVSS